MSRLLRLVMLVLLSTPLLGSSCGEPEAVPLEELQRDVPPAFDYALYSDAHGTLVGDRSGVLLVHRTAHLERVYADAQAGLLTWQAYSNLLGRFRRSLEFQRSVSRVLQQAREPGGNREWVSGMKQPLATENTGLKPEGSDTVTYVDDLVVDEATLGPGKQPNVHSFSIKQRDFSAMSAEEALEQLNVDAREARTKYGGTVEVRRPSHPLFKRKQD